MNNNSAKISKYYCTICASEGRVTREPKGKNLFSSCPYNSNHWSWSEIKHIQCNLLFFGEKLNELKTKIENLNKFLKLVGHKSNKKKRT